jgi:hypothetical protein
MNKIGILIIALGHKNYSKMAMMLAASLKANGCILPIAIAQDVDQIDEPYRKYFDQFITVKPHCYTWRGSICYIKAKAHMNEITPFEQTLFIDSDVIMINNGMINTIIESLAGVDFAIKNSGGTPFDSDKVTKDSMQWANLLEVKSAYNFTNEMIWNVHSEFIWWKKNEKTNELFKKWIENFEELKVTPINFAGCVPDELPLWISMCQLGIKPHQEMWHPTFWPMDGDGNKQLFKLRSDYCAISIGGKSMNPHQKSNYDNLCKIYQNMLGFPYLFLAAPKKRWLSERQNY